ncbi:hypothetical protein EIL50_05090 [bacterium NHP-B]|nr:hypothetical protein EIL50_05090 [bacterium NHP-B]
MALAVGADGQVEGISCDEYKITFSQDQYQAVSPSFCMPAEEESFCESFCERMKRFSLTLNTDSDLTDADLSTNTDANTETLAGFADDPDSLSTKLEALRNDINMATAHPRELEATLA